MKTRLHQSILFVTFITLSFAPFASCSRKERRPDELVVYAYDSFTAEWGAGPALAKGFAEKTGIAVTFVSCGDAGQVLSRAALEKDSPGADILLGIDNNLIERARALKVLEPYQSPAAQSAVRKDLRLADDWLVTPYDWGSFAIIYDSESKLPPPASLADLASPRYEKSLILMDPRTSTPGLGFAAWIQAVYGKESGAYWERLKPNVLTLAPGWDSGYGLFTAGEAPLVISYTTSPAYHLEYENTTRYRALIFPEGHPRQIEGLGVVKGAGNRAGARAFVDYMLSDEAQAALPLTQWMYPVSERVPLPACFSAAPVPSSFVSLSASEAEKAGALAVEALSR